MPATCPTTLPCPHAKRLDAETIAATLFWLALAFGCALFGAYFATTSPNAAGPTTVAQMLRETHLATISAILFTLAAASTVLGRLANTARDISTAASLGALQGAAAAGPANR